MVIEWVMHLKKVALMFYSCNCCADNVPPHTQLFVSQDSHQTKTRPPFYDHITHTTECG